MVSAGVDCMTFLGLSVSKRDITGNLILQLGSDYSYDPIASKSQARDLQPPESPSLSPPLHLSQETLQVTVLDRLSRHPFLRHMEHACLASVLGKN